MAENLRDLPGLKTLQSWSPPDFKGLLQGTWQNGPKVWPKVFLDLRRVIWGEDEEETPATPEDQSPALTPPRRHSSIAPIPRPQTLVRQQLGKVFNAFAAQPEVRKTLPAGMLAEMTARPAPREFAADPVLPISHETIKGAPVPQAMPGAGPVPTSVQKKTSDYSAPAGTDRSHASGMMVRYWEALAKSHLDRIKLRLSTGQIPIGKQQKKGLQQSLADIQASAKDLVDVFRNLSLGSPDFKRYVPLVEHWQHTLETLRLARGNALPRAFASLLGVANAGREQIVDKSGDQSKPAGKAKTTLNPVAKPVVPTQRDFQRAREGILWTRDQARRTFQTLEGRYGRQQAVGIFAAGQAASWGPSGIGSQASAQVGASAVSGMAPFAAMAEVYRRLNTNRSVLGSLPANAMSLAQLTQPQQASAGMAELPFAGEQTSPGVGARSPDATAPTYSSPEPPKQFASGGYVATVAATPTTVERKADGGPVGVVPGTGNSDSVPVELPPGSFVIKKKSVEALGAENLLAVREKFASGSVPSPRAQFESRVPALVTPGEFIFGPEESARIGQGTLHQWNMAGDRSGFAIGGSAIRQSVVSRDGQPVQVFAFGGTVSDVMDEAGKPKIAFHGTATGGFRQFDKSKQDPNALYGPGFYFTEDESIAKSYMGKGKVAHVLDKPLTPDLISKAIQFVNDGGYDSLGETQRILASGPEEAARLLADSGLGLSSVLREQLGLGLKPSEQKPETKSVFLNLRNPFDADKDRIPLEEVKHRWPATYARWQQMFSQTGQDSLSYHEFAYSVPRGGDWKSNQEAANAFLQELGYDGITHTGGVQGGKKHKVWIAFEPDQIKHTDEVEPESDEFKQWFGQVPHFAAGGSVPPELLPHYKSLRASVAEKGKEIFSPEGLRYAIRLSRHALRSKEVLENIPQGSEYLGSGISAVAFKTPEGEVMRAQPSNADDLFGSWWPGMRPGAGRAFPSKDLFNTIRPNIPEVLQATSAQTLPGKNAKVFLERLPFANKLPSDTAWEEISRLKKSALASGYDFFDDFPTNVGEVDGKTVITDPGAIKPIKGWPRKHPMAGFASGGIVLPVQRFNAGGQQYEFARDSAIPNLGKDFKDSARHKVNAWRGLAEAEQTGNAEEFLTRDQLLKNEPPNLLETLSPTTSLSSLAAHLAMKAFPAAPYDKKSLATYQRTKGATPPEDLRKQYYEAYQQVKAEAEKAATEETSPTNVTKRVHDLTSRLIKEFRGQSGDTSIAKVSATDRFNPVANALIDLSRKTTPYGRPAKTDVLGRMLDFTSRLKEAHGDDVSTETLRRAEEHVRAILEGASFNQAFGTVETKRGFDHATLYVKNAERKGGRFIDARSVAVGSDVMMGQMKMAGLQWGQSVSDKERIEHLQRSSEAFMDLADVLGLPDEAMSLEGKLGLAVGARGHGKALAHYEPDEKVINLTRKRGVGSLAHEWGHALDNYLAGQKGGYESELAAEEARPQWEYVPDDNGRYTIGNRRFSKKPKEPKPPDDPIRKASVGILRHLAESGFDKRLKEVVREKIRAGEIPESQYDYWTSQREVFARIFERHVQHKLHQQGRENTYLSGVEPHPLWPTEEESAAIAPALDELMQAVRAKHFPQPLAKQSAPAPGPIPPVQRPQVQAQEPLALATVSPAEKTASEPIPSDEALAAMSKVELLGLAQRHGVYIRLGVGASGLRKDLAQARAKGSPAAPGPFPPVERPDAGWAQGRLFAAGGRVSADLLPHYKQLRASVAASAGKMYHGFRHTMRLARHSLRHDDVLKNIPKGSEFLGAGVAGLAFRTPERDVVRVQPSNAKELIERFTGQRFSGSVFSTHRPKIREVLQPTESKVFTVGAGPDQQPSDEGEISTAKAVAGSGDIVSKVGPAKSVFYERMPFAPALSDFGMPEKDAWKVIRQLKERVQSKGYVFQDDHPGNVGRVGGPFGKQHAIIDPGAITPIPGLRQYEDDFSPEAMDEAEAKTKHNHPQGVWRRLVGAWKGAEAALRGKEYRQFAAGGEVRHRFATGGASRSPRRGEAYTSGGRFVGTGRGGVVWVCYGDDQAFGEMCQTFDQQQGATQAKPVTDSTLTDDEVLATLKDEALDALPVSDEVRQQQIAREAKDTYLEKLQDPIKLEQRWENQWRKYGQSLSKKKFGQFGKSNAALSGAVDPSFVEKVLGPGKDASIIPSLIGAPDDAEVLAEQSGSGIMVDVRHPDIDTMTRWIGRDKNGDLYIKNRMLVLQPHAQQQGEVGPAIFARQVEQAREHGVKYLSTHAARTGRFKAGYYAWPRFGYDQPLSAATMHDETHSAVKQQFPDAQSILDVMANEEGREWWRTHGSDLFEMKFNLEDDSRSMKVFKQYGEETGKWARGGPVPHRFSAGGAAPFFSRLGQSLEKMPPTMKSESLLPWLAKQGVTKEELQWTKMPSAIAGTPRLSREDMLEHFGANRVQVQEVLKGAPSNAPPVMWETVESRKTQYGDRPIAVKSSRGNVTLEYDDYKKEWVIAAATPDGKAQRVNTAASLSEAKHIAENAIHVAEGTSGGETRWGKYQTPGGENYRELLLTLPADFHKPKLVGELPFAKLEPQVFRSNHWDEANILAHVRFNDRTGDQGEKILRVEEIQSDWHQTGREKGYGTRQGWEVTAFGGRRSLGTFDSKEQAEQFATKEAKPNWPTEVVPKELKGVPDAPFKSSWHELAMLRMIRHAAEGGYDRIEWNTGEQIQSLVGGELGGQEEFYDKKLVNWASKFGKKFGATVTPGEGPTPHSIPLTDSMRKEALEKGFAMFAVGGPVLPVQRFDRGGGAKVTWHDGAWGLATNLLGHNYVNDQDIHELIGSPPDATINVRPDGSDAIRATATGPQIDFMQRRIFRTPLNKIATNNEYFALHPSAQKGGLGTQIFADQVRASAAMGLSHINTIGGRNRSKKDPMIGYYAWPRMGYDAVVQGTGFRGERPDILKGGKRASLQDIMATEQGREWWKQRGKQMSMWFDLTEGSRSRNTLNSYLAEKGLAQIPDTASLRAEYQQELFGRVRQRHEARLQQLRTSISPDDLSQIHARAAEQLKSLAKEREHANPVSLLDGAYVDVSRQFFAQNRIGAARGGAISRNRFAIGGEVPAIQNFAIASPDVLQQRREQARQALEAIPIGDLGHAASWPVRRVAENQWRVETAKGYELADAHTLADRLATMNEQNARLHGRRYGEALSRASSWQEPDLFRDYDRAMKESGAFDKLPVGARVVSLEPTTYGRLGSVVQDENTHRVRLDGSPDFASTHVEPLDQKLSWRKTEEEDRPVPAPLQQGRLFARGGLVDIPGISIRLAEGGEVPRHRFAAGGSLTGLSVPSRHQAFHLELPSVSALRDISSDLSDQDISGYLANVRQKAVHSIQGGEGEHGVRFGVDDSIRAAAHAAERIGEALKAQRRGYALGGNVAPVPIELLGRRMPSAAAAGGGLVPGTGNADTVPADLQPGSFVLRRQAVEALGAEQLEDIRSKLADGLHPSLSGGGTPVSLTPQEFVMPERAASKIGLPMLHHWNLAGDVPGVELKLAHGGSVPRFRFAEGGSLAGFSMPREDRRFRLDVPESFDLKLPDLDNYSQAFSQIAAKLQQSLYAGADTHGVNFDPGASRNLASQLAAHMLDYHKEGRRKPFRVGGPVTPWEITGRSRHGYAGGGTVQGIVPGTGEGDTVPADLEPGSFVIKKRSVEALGAGNLESIRQKIGAVQPVAKGGALVPALLTPQEFVFSAREAAQIGLPTLQQWNAAGDRPFARGGDVQPLRFDRGGPAPMTLDENLAKFRSAKGNLLGPWISSKFHEIATQPPDEMMETLRGNPQFKALFRSWVGSLDNDTRKQYGWKPAAQARPAMGTAVGRAMGGMIPRRFATGGPNPPEFVDLAGVKTRWADLPKAVQETVLQEMAAKTQQGKPQGAGAETRPGMKLAGSGTDGVKPPKFVEIDGERIPWRDVPKDIQKQVLKEIQRQRRMGLRLNSPTFVLRSQAHADGATKLSEQFSPTLGRASEGDEADASKKKIFSWEFDSDTGPTFHFNLTAINEKYGITDKIKGKLADLADTRIAQKTASVATRFGDSVAGALRGMFSAANQTGRFASGGAVPRRFDGGGEVTQGDLFPSGPATGAPGQFGANFGWPAPQPQFQFAQPNPAQGGITWSTPQPSQSPPALPPMQRPNNPNQGRGIEWQTRYTSGIDPAARDHLPIVTPAGFNNARRIVEEEGWSGLANRVRVGGDTTDGSVPAAMLFNAATLAAATAPAWGPAVAGGTAAAVRGTIRNSWPLAVSALFGGSGGGGGGGSGPGGGPGGGSGSSSSSGRGSSGGLGGRYAGARTSVTSSGVPGLSPALHIGGSQGGGGGGGISESLISELIQVIKALSQKVESLGQAVAASQSGQDEHHDNRASSGRSSAFDERPKWSWSADSDSGFSISIPLGGPVRQQPNF